MGSTRLDFSIHSNRKGGGVMRDLHTMYHYFSDKDLDLLCRLIKVRQIETLIKLDKGETTLNELKKVGRTPEDFENLRCKVEELKNNPEVA